MSIEKLLSPTEQKHSPPCSIRLDIWTGYPALLDIKRKIILFQFSFPPFMLYFFMLTFDTGEVFKNYFYIRDISSFSPVFVPLEPPRARESELSIWKFSSLPVEWKTAIFGSIENRKHSPKEIQNVRIVLSIYE